MTRWTINNKSICTRKSMCMICNIFIELGDTRHSGHLINWRFKELQSTEKDNLDTCFYCCENVREFESKYHKGREETLIVSVNCNFDIHFCTPDGV